MLNYTFLTLVVGGVAWLHVGLDGGNLAFVFAAGTFFAFKARVGQMLAPLVFFIEHP